MRGLSKNLGMFDGFVGDNGRRLMVVVKITKKLNFSTKKPQNLVKYYIFHSNLKNSSQTPSENPRTNQSFNILPKTYSNLLRKSPKYFLHPQKIPKGTFSTHRLHTRVKSKKINFSV